MVNSEKQINYDTSYNQNFYCQLKINDIPIIPGNIISLVIREWALELVPRIHLVFQDDGVFSEINTIQDLDTITVELARTPDTKLETTYTGTFSVLDWKCNLLADNRLHLIEVTGFLNIPSLFAPIKTRAFRNKNSIDVLSSIGYELGLDVIKRNNFSNNADTMTWLQVNQSNSDFLKHVTSYAFRNEDLIMCYADSKKQLNITSLNTELDKKEEISGKYNIDKFTSNVLSDEDINVLWYSSYDYVNVNGYLNKLNNYGRSGNYYDLSKNKEFSVTDNSHKFSELGFKNENFKASIVKQDTYNIQSKNVHANFLKAKSQNDYLINNFFGYSLVINAHASVKIDLMDTVMLSVPSLPYHDPDSINELLTGRYLVGGIVYMIGKNTGFQKHVSLHRNGFNKSFFQKSYNL